MPDGRIVLTLVMLALFGASVGLATQLPAQAAFMPYLVGIPGVLFCAGQLVIDIRAARAPKPPPDALPDAPQARPDRPDDEGQTEAQMFLWLGLFTAVLIGFGFVWGGPVLVGLFVRFASRESWINAAFAALGTLAVLWGVFVWLLQLHMFQGLVIRLLT